MITITIRELIAIKMNRLGIQGEKMMEFKKNFLMIIPVVLGVVILTVCTLASTRNNEIVKLGVIYPQTGTTSQVEFGQELINGIELAVENYNSKGGVLGKKIETVVYDSKYDPVEAVKAFERLANEDKVDAVIGGEISSTALALAPLSVKYNLPMITPTATNVDVTKGKKTVFRACLTDAYQGKGLAQFAYDKLNARKAAVMYNKEIAYSVGLAKAFREAFEEKGAEVVSYQEYANDTKDFNDILLNIKKSNPDVLFIPDYYDTIVPIIKQVKQVGIDIQLLGSDAWDGWRRAENGGEILEGSYYSGQYSEDYPTPVNRDFVKAYNEKYKEIPKTSASPLAYDAVGIILEAVKKAGTTDYNEVIKMLEATNYSGVTGHISFDRQHNPIKPIYMFKMQEGENILIQILHPE